jgi:hypothetical protein
LRGILKGTKPGTRSRTTAPNGIEVELYDRRRFISITGGSIAEDEEAYGIHELQGTLDVFYGWLFLYLEKALTTDAECCHDGNSVASLGMACEPTHFGPFWAKHC